MASTHQKKQKTKTKTEKFVQFEPYDFVQISPACGTSNYLGMYAEILDVLCHYQQW